MFRYKLVKTFRGIREDLPTLYQKMVWLFFKLMILLIVAVAIGGIFGLC